MSAPRNIPAAAVIATRDRAEPLRATLRSLAAQSALPATIIVVDSSPGGETKAVCDAITADLPGIQYQVAHRSGAASQRNEGVAAAPAGVPILFMDDDIAFEPECLARLWGALHSDPAIGGVNAMITNQKYGEPGKLTRWLYEYASDNGAESFAGKCLGPGINVLPADDPRLPDVVPVEWLNTTCVLYRREALPVPPFRDFFQGASTGEDLALSLIVRREWKLANARTARIFHDNLSGSHKRSLVRLGREEVVNRHYIMREILRQRGGTAYAQLAAAQLISLAGSARSRGGWRGFAPLFLGKVLGALAIATGSAHRQSPTDPK
ncbi:MAG: glycosyltransferase family 2 protein [Verrucomicrobiales bacterium]